MPLSLWRLSKTLVFLALAFFFVERVYKSVLKLRDARVATTSAFSQDKDIDFPALTFCPLTIDEASVLQTDEDFIDLEPNVNVSDIIGRITSGGTEE